MIKRIFIVLVAIIVFGGIWIGVNALLAGNGETPAPPTTTAQDDAPAANEPVWTGGGTEPVNAGIELADPPLEVLVFDAKYTGLTSPRATVSLRVTVNNLGPTGLGSWFERPNAFTLYSASGGTVQPAAVKVASKNGPETRLVVEFTGVPSQPLTANQVALAIRITGQPTTDVAFGLTPPTADSLDAEKVVPPAEEKPAAPEAAPKKTTPAPTAKSKKVVAKQPAKKQTRSKASKNKKDKARAKK